MICDARNWNLFLMPFFMSYFLLICVKMGRLRFSSLNDFRLTFGHLSFSLSLSTWLLDKLYFSLQMVSSSSSMILAYLSVFQSSLVPSKTFIAKHHDPDSFRCKSFRLKCLLVIFLLSTTSFNCSKWLANWFTVSVAFSLSDRSVGVEIYTL